MSKDRGIVFCPQFEIESDGAVYFPSAQISPQQFRFFCLYWDYIIHPIRWDIPEWKRSHDEIVLEDASILIRDIEDVPLGSQKSFVRENAYSMRSEGDDLKFLKATLDYQYKSLERAQKTRNDVLWTPQQSYREFQANPDQSIDTHGVQLELHKKLPVPSESASIKKIVAFKYHNRELFQEFKSSIDKLTSHVAKHNIENVYAINLALIDIEKIVTEITNASRQKWGKLIRFDELKVQISSANLSTVIKDFFRGAAVTGENTGELWSSVLGGSARASTNFIQISPIKSKRLNCLPVDQLEFSYLTEAYENKILSL